MTRRVLVTGAGGFVGRTLCPELAAAGLSVRAAARHPFPCPTPPDRFEFFSIGSVGPDTDWSRALEGVDAVVHLAARTHILGAAARKDLAAFREVNVEGTRGLARAGLQAGVRRMVMLSSVKAMGEETTPDRPLSEEDPCHPADPYGISKLEAEQTLQETAASGGMETVVLRPPLVYGPGVGANFLRLLKLIDRGFLLPLGSVRNRRSLLFVRNLTSAIVRCLDHPCATGKVFLVADEEVLSTSELVRRLGELLGRSPRVLPIPMPVLRAAGRISGRQEDVRRLTGSLLLSTDRIRRSTDWRPPFPVSEALRSTVAWYRSTRN